MPMPPTTLYARRKELADRLLATCQEVAPLIDQPIPNARRAELLRAMAGGLEAIFVEQAWEALRGRTPFLSDVQVALREMHEAGRGDGGPLLANFIEAARNLRGYATETEEASGLVDLETRSVMAASAILFFNAARIGCEAVGASDAAAACGDLYAEAERLDREIEFRIDPFLAIGAAMEAAFRGEPDGGRPGL